MRVNRFLLRDGMLMLSLLGDCEVLLMLGEARLADGLLVMVRGRRVAVIKEIGRAHV